MADVEGIEGNNEDVAIEDIDIFNHRSSSRLYMSRHASRSRCKSQPHSLDVHDPVWMAHSEAKGRERKSLSPNTLRAYSTLLVGENDKSLFDPQSFQTLYLPAGGNKPLDPMAVSAVHRTLVDTPANILAIHLTYLDLRFFGLLKETSHNVRFLIVFLQSNFRKKRKKNRQGHFKFRALFERVDS